MSTGMVKRSKNFEQRESVFAAHCRTSMTSQMVTLLYFDSDKNLSFHDSIVLWEHFHGDTLTANSTNMISK